MKTINFFGKEIKVLSYVDHKLFGNHLVVVSQAGIKYFIANTEVNPPEIKEGEIRMGGDIYPDKILLFNPLTGVLIIQFGGGPSARAKAYFWQEKYGWWSDPVELTPENLKFFSKYLIEKEG